MGSVQIPIIIIITTALTLGPACLLAEFSRPDSNDSPKLGLGAYPYSTEEGSLPGSNDSPKLGHGACPSSIEEGHPHRKYIRGVWAKITTRCH